MEIKIEQLTNIKLIQEASMNTVNKKLDAGKEMTPELFRKYLISEHSPIRSMMLRIHLLDIPYYNSVHIARHHVGMTHYVTTHRPDRTGAERTIHDMVNHLMDINIQGLIDMARKRLCKGKCDKVTYEIMLAVKTELMNSQDDYLKVIGEMLVPNCIYRYGCPEFRSCGLSKVWSDNRYGSIQDRYSHYNNIIRNGVI